MGNMDEKVKIAYGFSNCSNKVYSKLYANKKQFVMVTDQKYHKLLHIGFIKNGAKVECFSGLPINRSVCKKICIREKDDEEDGIQYHYMFTLNLPIVRQVMVFIASFFRILRNYKKYNCIICDFMSTMNALGMGLAGKIRGIPVIYIIMDLPGLMNTDGKPLQGIHRVISELADGFIILTQQMNNIVNRRHKPYIIMEGHVDSTLHVPPETEKWECKDGKQVIIYAGGIHKIFGIENLVYGFIKASIANSELWIYGDGDYKNELLDICKTNHNIKYMGVADNKEIVYKEQRASLLVNPRPTKPIYTQYSFPSKNMEYMISGTPVLTTNLPGMPSEYREYVYLINDETADGIADSLKTVLRESIENRNIKASKARQFVLQNKSNVVQARRIISFISNDVIKK